MDLTLILPELVIASLAFLILGIALLVPRKQQKSLGYVTLVGLVGVLGTSFLNIGGKKQVFQEIFIIDSYAVFFKFLFLLSSILVVLSAIKYVNRISEQQGEFYAMLLFATLGMMILASAGGLIIFYLGLELMTISFYVLTAYYKGNKKSSEAGIKYLILGALSSAILLYGLSIIYGITGSTALKSIARTLSHTEMGPTLLLGIIFLISGLAFKISAVPFHMWAPDVYEGAPTPVTAFLAVASKAAGFAVIIRFLLFLMPGANGSWVLLLGVIATLTVVLGNLVAIPQTNIKRLLAYSSIAHAGYLLFGVLAFSTAGVMAVLFYLVIYLFANLGAFIVVSCFANNTGSNEIKDYAGLSKRSPFLAVVMLLSLLSLAGIPPLAGFVGKFYLFTSVIAKDYYLLAFIGVIMNTVSVYYYLQVIRTMYFKEPASEEQIIISNPVKLALTIACVVTLILGVYPGPVTSIANQVAITFF